jgi:hemerythrin-like domain-containing protein
MSSESTPIAPSLKIKIILFDIRNTLGLVDRPGHLMIHPTSESLFKVLGSTVRYGVITNLPDNVTAEQGRTMLESAIIGAQKLTDYLDPNGIFINHEVGLSKPDPRIFLFAAEKMGASPEECLWIGENLLENVGAQAAGMRALLKPWPVGSELLSIAEPPPASEPAGLKRFAVALMNEHKLGERIFDCGSRIVEMLSVGTGLSPSEKALSAMDSLIYLVDWFADPVHLQAEEDIIRRSYARGVPKQQVQWVFDHHNQARAYWQAMTVAWQRINGGDPDDQHWAVNDFRVATEAFVALFRHHAVRENTELYPLISGKVTDADDEAFMRIIDRKAQDVTAYIEIVASLEETLGISPPAT